VEDVVSYRDIDALIRMVIAALDRTSNDYSARLLHANMPAMHDLQWERINDSKGRPLCAGSRSSSPATCPPPTSVHLRPPCALGTATPCAYRITIGAE